MNDRWQKFPGREALDRSLAAHLAAVLRRDITATGSACLALSGGSTPLGLFAALTRETLDWRAVSLTLVDERWVDPEHPDSNETKVREYLYQGDVQQARLVGLKTPHPRAAEGEHEASARIQSLPLPFSAVVLGMGSDGHTASWFPQAANLPRLLAAEGPDLVAATEPVTAPHPRMTLTLAAVLASREIIIHITGEEKQTVLNDAIANGYPVAAVLKQTRTPVTIWWAP